MTTSPSGSFSASWASTYISKMCRNIGPESPKVLSDHNSATQPGGFGSPNGRAAFWHLGAAPSDNRPATTTRRRRSR
jgi:hypothetical protein